MSERINLVDIVGREPHPDHPRYYSRIVEFEVTPDGLGVREMCDECFGITLTAEEVDRLIAWLTAARDRMEQG
jgi:hypothetical protein